MDYINTKALVQDLQTGAHHALNRRRTKRHPLRTRALVGVPGKSAIRGYIVDISAGGLSVSLPVATGIGTECMMFFTVVVEGQVIAVSGRGKVVNCTCTSSDGFRIGMRFQAQDPQAQDALNKLLGTAATPVENEAGLETR